MENTSKLKFQKFSARSQGPIVSRHRHCPSPSTVAVIVVGLLFLAAIVTVSVFWMLTSNRPQPHVGNFNLNSTLTRTTTTAHHRTAARPRRPPKQQQGIYQARIHGGISRHTGGNGNGYWQYCALRANHSITAVSFGIFGPPEGGRYRIRIKFVEEGNIEALGETEAIAHARGDPANVYFVQLMEPVQLKADTWYRAYVYISEGPPNTFYGTQGRRSENVSCGGDRNSEGCSVHFEYKFKDGQPYSVGFKV